MDELLAKASVPADGTVFIGKLMEEPFLSKALNKFMGPRYSLHVRPLSFSIMQEQPPSRSTDSRERIIG